jgi:hypothetical protein
MRHLIKRNEPVTQTLDSGHENHKIAHLTDDIRDSTRCDFPHIDYGGDTCLDLRLFRSPAGTPVVLKNIGSITITFSFPRGGRWHENGLESLECNE